jgi:hypothetical protein
VADATGQRPFLRAVLNACVYLRVQLNPLLALTNLRTLEMAYRGELLMLPPRTLYKSLCGLC